MKAYGFRTGFFNRKRGNAAQSVFKVGSVALVVFVIAMALMPLTANNAFAADDDDKPLIQSELQLDPNLIDVQPVDPTPTPTPRALQIEDPSQIDIGDRPLVELPEVTPDTEPGLISVYVNKLGCPQGFDAYGADIYGLAASCQDILNGVGFELHNNSGDIVFTHTGDIQDHMAVWDPIHEGDQTIEEVLPSGYTNQPRVFCKVTDAAGVESAEVEMGLTPTAVGFSITQHVDAGGFLWCDWFNIPNAGTADVFINKIGCPAGFDAYAASIYDLAYNCHDVQTGVEFTVNTTVGPVSKSTGNLPPSVTFEDITAGDISITETLPDGYGQPRVFCKIGDALGAESSEDEQTVDPAGPSINAHLNDQEYLWCDWFNIPESDNGDITIWKFDCPEGTDPLAADETYYQTECTTPMDGVHFELHRQDVNGAVQQGTTGDAGPGQIHWTDVAPGVIGIFEDVPDGYYDPVVYCGFSYTIETEAGLAIADGIVPVTSALGGVLEHEFQPKESLGCWWYNIPRGDTEITIYKYTCPEGYDLTELGSNPEVDCPSLTNGVKFTLKGGAVDLQTSTGDSIDGAVYWGGLEAGDYQVVEELPEGTVAILVNCTTTNPDGSPYKFSFTPGVDNPQIDLSLVKGQKIICHWFNDPYEEPDGGDLVVNKYWCYGAVYSVESCDLYTGDVQFTLKSASGEGDPISFNTAGDGTYETYLPAGAYELEEQGGWCYASANYTDPAGNLVIQDGYKTIVDVFNCGPNDQGKEPPVKKYPNTGMAPVAVTIRALFS